MKNMKKLLTRVLALLLTGCAAAPAAEGEVTAVEEKVTSDSLYVAKVEGMPEDFILGMDASCVPALEKSGVKYYDHAGNEKDVYQILRIPTGRTGTQP